MIGYKLLTTDLKSVSTEYGQVQYGLDWQTVPGNGAYVAHTPHGLLRGGYGPVLAEMEYADPTGVVADGHVTTARRVRVIRYGKVDLRVKKSPCRSGAIRRSLKARWKSRVA